MLRWIQRIARSNDPLGLMPEAIEFFAQELEEGRKVLKMDGQKIVSKLQAMPAEIEYHFRLSQEAEQILKFLERMEEKKIVEKMEWLASHYHRAMSDANMRKLAEQQPEVIDIYLIRCEVAMIRNDYLALFKGLETQSFKLKDIVEIHKAMLEDAVFVTRERD
jgi:hypothetical protein